MFFAHACNKGHCRNPHLKSSILYKHAFPAAGGTQILFIHSLVRHLSKCFSAQHDGENRGCDFLCLTEGLIKDPTAWWEEDQRFYRRLAHCCFNFNHLFLKLYLFRSITFQSWNIKLPAYVLILLKQPRVKWWFQSASSNLCDVCPTKDLLVSLCSACLMRWDWTSQMSE